MRILILLLASALAVFAQTKSGSKTATSGSVWDFTGATVNGLKAVQVAAADFTPTRTSDTVLTFPAIAANAFRVGDTSCGAIGSATFTVSAGTGTAYIVIAKDCLLTVRHPVTGVCSANCTAVTNPAVPQQTDVALYSWGVSAGVYAGSGTQLLSPYNAFPIEAGTKLSSTVSGGTKTINANATLVDQNLAEITGTANSGTDAYTVTLTPAVSDCTGMTVIWSADVANTGAAALAVGSCASAPIKKLKDQDLVTGDIEAGQRVITSFDGTNWQMQSQTAAAAAGGGYATIDDEDTPLTQRTTVNMTGAYATCVDNAGAAQTDCTIEGAAVTESLTNKTISYASNSILVRDFIDWPLAVCRNNVASFTDNVSTPTAGAATAACMNGTNQVMGLVTFADTATNEVQLTYRLADDDSATQTYKLLWKTSATTGNVKWQVSQACITLASTGTLDIAWEATSTATTAVLATTNAVQSTSITGSNTGCGAGQLKTIRIFRDPADAADTAGADVDVILFEVVASRTQ